MPAKLGTMASMITLRQGRICIVSQRQQQELYDPATVMEMLHAMQENVPGSTLPETRL